MYDDLLDSANSLIVFLLALTDMTLLFNTATVLLVFKPLSAYNTFLRSTLCLSDYI